MNHFTFLSLHWALYKMKTQVRDLNYGSPLAFMFLESIPRVRTYWDLSSSALRYLEDTGREAQTPSAKTWMQPQNLSQHRVPDIYCPSVAFACKWKLVGHSWSVQYHFTFIGWANPDKPRLPKSIRQSLCWKESSRPALALLLNITSSTCPISLATEYNNYRPVGLNILWYNSNTF